jgi:selenocysteine lyase/cysteine desulfurase
LHRAISKDFATDESCMGSFYDEETIAKAAGTETFSPEEVRKDFPILHQKVNGKPLVWFDNAATTPTFIEIQDEVNAQLAYYGSIGRGHGQKSVHSTEIYENGRKLVLDFVNADPEKYTVFYVGNTTDGLNKLSSALITSKDDIVLVSRMEHHANDLNWRHRATPIYAEVDEQGRLLLSDVERLLSQNQVKYVSITAASNVTGYVNDVHAIAKLAHQYGAKMIVDGAQIAAHRAFDMQGASVEEQIDFFVFSAHKMYAPYGGGAVVGPTEVLNQNMPKFYGGGTVDVVSDYTETYLAAPALYEAGSPNYPGVVSMLMAIDNLKTVGFDYIVEHEQRLMRKAFDGLTQIAGVELYGDVQDIADKVGIVVFNIDGHSHGDVAQALADKRAIATRQGAFCSHPYVWRLLGIPDNEILEIMKQTGPNLPGMVRASFGIYNNEAEVDTFLETVQEIAESAK